MQDDDGGRLVSPCGGRRSGRGWMMIPVLTAEQSRRSDEATEAPVEVLVERAGAAVAGAAVRLGAGYGMRTAVLAGPGDNGADGYVAAGFLSRRGLWVDVYPFLEPRSPAAVWARERAAADGAAFRSPDSPRPAKVVVDALFGGGFRGELPDLSFWRSATGGRRLAADVPSGLDASTGRAAEGTLPAAATITFGGLRVGHLLGDGPDLCGEVRVADIGLAEVEPELRLCEEGDAPLPVRSRTAHKWSAGSVLVVGGSQGLDGAATLTARAALRAGAGAVMIACPPTVEEKVRSPEIMTRAIGAAPFLGPERLPEVLELAARFDVLALGPGLGATEQTANFTTGLLRSWEGPLLADADALNALDSPDLLRRTPPTVITPHAGEFQRLTGAKADYRAAAALTKRTGAVVLLKGNPTFVTGKQRWVITEGGPELATIGTGDVLAGMIAAFWSAGQTPETAARSAAFWHARTAAHLAQSQTPTADTLLTHLPKTTLRPHPHPTMC